MLIVLTGWGEVLKRWKGGFQSFFFFFFFAGVEEYRTIFFRGIYYNLMLIIGYLRSSYFYHLLNFWSVANVAIFN